MQQPDGALFKSAAWGPALEKFGAVSGLSVWLFGSNGRPIRGPLHSTPLAEVFRRRRYDPGILLECASRCRGRADRKPSVVRHRYGLAAVGASLTLAGEVVGAAVAAYALTEYPKPESMHTLAEESGLKFSTLWDAARKEIPLRETRLILYAELLQTLADAILSETHRTSAFEESSRRLAEAIGAKDRFFAILSHELRTPLTPILAWTQVLRREAQADCVRHAADVIDRNARLQTRLVDDLLDINRITQGKIDLRLRPLDVTEVLRAAIDGIVETAERKGLRIDRFEPHGYMIVNGDAGRLQQVFDNVLSNALKFTPAGGSVGVTLTREGEYAVARIRDSGVGIAPEFLPAAFDMFRQQEEGTVRQYGGLGIGLSLAKSLTELHAGTIEAASDGIGHGTEMTIRLPLIAGDVPTVSLLPRPESALSRLDGLSILLIEDVDDLSEATRAMLERLGARVDIAADGRIALDIVASSSPSVILCDLRMPGIDGFEFIRRLRWTQPVHAPVIAVSGLSGAADRELTRRAGFQGHLGKPFDYPELLKAIQSAVGEAPSPRPGDLRMERSGRDVDRSLTDS
jgi:signal transduction histidine kinase/ActR/RegA family two-component response regulator